MYPLVLSIHNLVRWVALILGIVAAASAYLGWSGRGEWSPRERRLGSFFTIAMDIQLLLGLILFVFLSPVTRTAFQNIAAAIQGGDLRFFMLVHPLYMLLAVIIAHLGSILSRRAVDAIGKFRRAALWYSLSMLAMIVGMPWMSRLLPGLA